ncbi:hypothetical protein ES319_A13G141000v1 [Gossypium barbadense]|uniref:Uncharacterized protein n=1 Tax=Gossypium barbadense TaxID=3634 RepID=A0A5J5SZ29_GOSBA|nr:hypothetical protein ES319_A13G141000v1 [Gossypium barbadense]
MYKDNLLLRQIFLIWLVCGIGGYTWSGLLHNVGSKSKIAECDVFF